MFRAELSEYGVGQLVVGESIASPEGTFAEWPDTRLRTL